MNPIRKEKVYNITRNIWESLIFVSKITVFIFVIISCILVWVLAFAFISNLGKDISILVSKAILMNRIVIICICFLFLDMVMKNLGVFKK